MRNSDTPFSEKENRFCRTTRLAKRNKGSIDGKYAYHGKIFEISYRSLQHSQGSQPRKNEAYKFKTNRKKENRKVTLTVTAQECKYCKGSHSIYKCEDLQKLSPTDRKKEIISKRR